MSNVADDIAAILRTGASLDITPSGGAAHMTMTRKDGSRRRYVLAIHEIDEGVMSARRRRSFWDCVMRRPRFISDPFADGIRALREIACSQ